MILPMKYRTITIHTNAFGIGNRPQTVAALQTGCDTLTSSALHANNALAVFAEPEHDLMARCCDPIDRIGSDDCSSIKRISVFVDAICVCVFFIHTYTLARCILFRACLFAALCLHDATFMYIGTDESFLSRKWNWPPDKQTGRKGGGAPGHGIACESSRIVSTYADMHVCVCMCVCTTQ